MTVRNINFGRQLLQTCLYASAAFIFALAGALPVFATPTFDEYNITSTYASPNYIRSANGSLWYRERASGASSDTLAKMNTSGTVVADYSLLDPQYANTRALQLIAGSDGNIWFTGCALQKNSTSSVGVIGKFNTTTNALTTTPVSVGGCDATSSLKGLTLGPDGNVWFSVRVVSDYYIFEINGSNVITQKAYGSGSIGYDLVTGSDGNLWTDVSQSGSSIVRKYTYNTTTGNLSGYTDYPISFTPASNVVATNGNIWFSRVGGNGAVERFDITNGSVTEYAPPSAGDVVMASGPDGAIWYTQFQSGKIGRISTAGSITEYTIPTSSSSPVSITSGPDGAIWFTELTANKVGRLGY